MIANLPKELLWTDMKDISEMKSNKLRKLLDGIVSFDQTTNSGLWSELNVKDMLNLYNEAFYLCTRIIYEHDADASPETYLEDIKSKLGDERAYFIAFLMFFILILQSDKSDEVVLFTDKLQKAFLLHWTSKTTNFINKTLKPRINNVEFRLKPYPNSANELQNILLDWHGITQGFSKQIIVELLNLWDSEDEKGKVIRLIEQAYMSLLTVTKEDEAADKADENFFEQQKSLYIVTNDEKDVNAVEDELFKDGIDKEYVREKVKDLVQEFYRGEDKNLALIEIVLFKCELIKKINKHQTFVKNLKNWGKLPKKQDKEKNQNKEEDSDEADTKRIANNMSSEFRDLKNNKKVGNILKYEEWGKELNERKICISIENKLAQLMNWQSKS